MSTIHVEASEMIDARPETVYAILSDYRVGHPAILPKSYFTGLSVEQGGQGAGTVINVDMNVYGRKFHYHQAITEPEPGHALVETDAQAGVVTRFTVEPVGSQTRVTIASDLPISPGLMGFFERLMTPPVIQRIYRAELKQLADYARSHTQ